MAATVAAHAGVGSLAVRAASTRARCRAGGRAVWANGARDGAPRTEATGRARGDAERECRRERHEVETPSTSSVGGRAFGALAAAVIASAGAGAGEHIAALAAGPLSGVKSEVTKDLRLVEREIQIDAEIIERDIERVPLTLENFIAKEPPILVGMFFLACINGTIGLFWALFFRETVAGPGGEFGKGIVALRKEVVKGIFKFFGSILGSYVRER